MQWCFQPSLSGPKGVLAAVCTYGSAAPQKQRLHLGSQLTSRQVMAEITSRSPGQGDDVLLLVPHRLFGGVVSQDCKASAEPRGMEGGMFGGNEQNLVRSKKKKLCY